jgi:hypothetical protein
VFKNLDYEGNWLDLRNFLLKMLQLISQMQFLSIGKLVLLLAKINKAIKKHLNFMEPNILIEIY